jgi:hypothetical protein
MLKSIIIITLIVQQLATVEPAYRDHLHYQTVARGVVSAELAGLWDAPAVRGDPYILMQPASGSAVYLRFIEEADTRDRPATLTTFGWAVPELLVTDPDELARRLENSAFKVIGPPKDLFPSEKAPRAMQVQGPDDEILYLTRTLPGGSRYDLGAATSFVDRTFIVVVGGPSMSELRRFYGEVLGLQVDEPSPFVIGVLARANGLPPDTKFPLAIAPVAPGYLIELDEYPSVARPRAVAKGSLPPRMAMVSFLAEAPDQLKVRWRTPFRKIAEQPYASRRAAVTIGPAGEWLEVIEVNQDSESTVSP